MADAGVLRLHARRRLRPDLLLRLFYFVVPPARRLPHPSVILETFATLLKSPIRSAKGDDLGDAADRELPPPIAGGGDTATLTNARRFCRK